MQNFSFVIRNLLFTGAALLLSAAVTEVKAQIEFSYSVEEAFEKATIENKLIFLDAYTTWCGPCKKMDREVFVNEQVGNFYNENFVSLKLDMEKGSGIEVAGKYDINVYPTLLFLKPNGEVAHRTAGYHFADEFIKLGEQALDPENNLSGLEGRFNEGDRDPEFLLRYTIASYEAMNGTHGPIAEAYLGTQQDWTTRENLQLIYTMVDNVDSPLFAYLRDNSKHFHKIYAEAEVNARIEEIIYQNLYSLGEKPGLEQVDELFKKAYPSKADKLSTRYRIRYYLEKDDFENYAASAVKYFKKYPSPYAEEWNEEAWNFYQLINDRKMLKKAVKWAKKSIRIENAYYNNDTLAALYFKLGKKRRAMRAAEKAIALAKENNEDPSATEDLLDMIKEM